MTWGLAEGAVTALAGVIDSDMAAKVSALNTEFSDNVTLAAHTAPIYKDPLTVTDGTAGAQWPVFAVYATDTEGSIFDNGTSSASLVRVEILLRFATDNIDADDLRVRAYRYDRAVREIIGDNLGGVSGWAIHDVACRFQDEADGNAIGGCLWTLNMGAAETR